MLVTPRPISTSLMSAALACQGTRALEVQSSMAPFPSIVSSPASSSAHSRPLSIVPSARSAASARGGTIASAIHSARNALPHRLNIAHFPFHHRFALVSFRIPPRAGRRRLWHHIVYICFSQNGRESGKKFTKNLRLAPPACQSLPVPERIPSRQPPVTSDRTGPPPAVSGSRAAREGGVSCGTPPGACGFRPRRSRPRPSGCPVR